MRSLVQFVKGETKLNSGMRNPEIHALAMGRMMCLSAILESGAFSEGKLSKSQQEVLGEILALLLEINREQEFLRESI